MLIAIDDNIKFRNGIASKMYVNASPQIDEHGKIFLGKDVVLDEERNYVIMLINNETVASFIIYVVLCLTCLI